MRQKLAMLELNDNYTRRKSDEETDDARRKKKTMARDESEMNKDKFFLSIRGSMLKKEKKHGSRQGNVEQGHVIGHSSAGCFT